MSNVKHQTSNVKSQKSKVIRQSQSQTSNVKHQTSKVKSQKSYVIRHTSYVIRQSQSQTSNVKSQKSKVKSQKAYVIRQSQSQSHRVQIWVSEGQAIAQVARLSPCLSLRGLICPYLTCQSCLLSHPFHMASCILLSNLASIGNSLLDSQGTSSN